ncbi:MAG TPA: SDR family NAD(P)-dependent oxidoreductase, partial [Victivallales bacterium]|nr:SDR family NAD(P)-dependent oxidoreductase [Victivallales bacterium]
MNLLNKRVFITGGALRIGREIALALAELGAIITISYNESKEESKKLLKILSQKNSGHSAVKLELNRKIPANFFDKIGLVDILINNASVYFPDDFTKESFDNIENQFKVNFLSPLFLSKLFYMQVKNTGSIINMLDCRINNLERADGSYWLSKKALHSATELLAVQYAPKVRVNAIAPGAILPPSKTKSFSLEKAAQAAPLQKLPTLKNLTDAVIFLLEN